MTIKFLTLLCAVTILSSCLKQKESITPLAPPQTLADLQRESLMNTANLAGNSELSSNALSQLAVSSEPGVFYLDIKYHMTNIDVFEAAQMPNTFEQIGHGFLQMAAKFVLAVAGPRQININDIAFKIPESMDLDRSVVKSIKIKRIFITYNKDVDIASDYAANFSFIDTLELAREVTVPNIGKVNTLFLSYRKARNFCMYKCIQFEVLEDNLIDMLKPNSNIYLKPALSVGSLPDVTDLKLDGEIEIRIGLRLPF
jgi:hypothetical protein